mgnify:CR=1 FL=1
MNSGTGFGSPFGLSAVAMVFELLLGEGGFTIKDALYGRLAQRESACLTSKMSQVQSLYRPPCLVSQNRRP